MKVLTALIAVLFVAFAAFVSLAEAQGYYPTLYGWERAGYANYGQPSTTQQVNEWISLAERGFGLVPQAAAGIVLTERIWESRSPRPPAQVVYTPAPPPPAPPVAVAAPVVTGRLVVVTGPGELFINGDSQGQFKNREVKYFDLPAGNHSLIMRTDKKVLIKEARVQPGAATVINFDP